MFVTWILTLTVASLPVLKPGDAAEGAITPESAVVSLSEDKRYPDVEPRSTGYRLEIPDAGPHTLELRSDFFDAYLVLRDSAGEILAEDDNGLAGFHARLEVAGGRFYRVDAVSLDGAAGAFEIRLTPGAPPKPTSRERAEADLAEARRAFEARTNTLGESHERTIAAREELTWQHFIRGEYAEAESLLEGTLRMQRAAYGPEDPRVANSENNLARVLHLRGDFAGAKELFTRSIAVLERELGPDDVDLAIALDGLALVLQDEGDLAGARRTFQRALRILESTIGAEDTTTASTMNNLASLYQAEGDVYAAKILFERALSVRTKLLPPDHPELSESLNNLALLLKGQGKLDEAMPLLERARDILVAKFGTDHPNLARCYGNIGAIYRAQGNYDAAQEMQERALAISEATLGPDHYFTAITLTNLGQVYHDQLAVDAAAESYQRSISILEKTIGPDHSVTAATRSSYASLLRDVGMLTPAQEMAERSLEARKAFFGSDHPVVAQSLNLISALYWDQGRLEECVAMVREAVRISSSALGDAHPNTAESLNNLAFVLADLGEIEEAWRIVRRAVHAHDSLRRALEWTLPESERILFARTRMISMQTLLSLARLVGTEEAERDGYEACLAWKGSVGRSLTQSRGAAIGALDEKGRGLVSQLIRTQASLQKELFRPQVEDRAAHDARLKELRSEVSRQEGELLRSIGEEAVRTERVTFASVVESLPEGAAFVDILVHPVYRPARVEDGSVVEPGGMREDRVTAWVANASDRKLHRVDLGPASDLQTSVQAFLEEMGAKRGVKKVTPEKANADLRQRLWEPLRPYIRDARDVFVSPDGFLGGLALGVLQDKGGDYLIEKHAFVYLQEMASIGAVASGAPEASGAPRDLLCIGGVDYRGEPGEKRGAHKVWTSLPSTKSEIGTIAELHEQKYPDRERTVLMRKDATEGRLKEELSLYRVIHLATHGFSNPNGLPSMWDRIRDESGRARMVMRAEIEQITGLHPGLLSGLVLSGANRPNPGLEDGFLTAEEISFLDMSAAELVVLSACSTGVGGEIAGEGMIGLRRTLRQAGARTVISSLWRVPDDATSRLMQRFYVRLWEDGEPKLQALRGAKLDVLRENRIDNEGDGLPVTWGGFVLDGAWD